MTTQERAPDQAAPGEDTKASWQTPQLRVIAADEAQGVGGVHIDGEVVTHS